MSDVKSGGDIADSSIITGDHNVVSTGNKPHIAEVVDHLERRIEKIEELLGGYLGIPGLTHEIREIKKDLHEIKTEMYKSYVPISQKIYLGVSTAALLVSAFYWLSTIL